jgi:hypothetical protein
MNMSLGAFNELINERDVMGMGAREFLGEGISALWLKR